MVVGEAGMEAAARVGVAVGWAAGQGRQAVGWVRVEVAVGWVRVGVARASPGVVAPQS